MTRLLSVVAIAVATMLVAPCVWAQILYPANATIAWYKPLDDSAICVCPKGDFSQLDVTLIDQFGSPMADYPVTVTFSNSLVKSNSDGSQVFSGTTNAAGYVRIQITAGVDNTGPLAIQSDVTVRGGVYIVMIYYDLYVLSPDYNASYTVDSADGSVFASHWHINDPIGMADCVSNFSRADPCINSLDGSAFAAHWQH